jgi:hypothetical protein
MMKLFFCNYHKLERDIHVDQQVRAIPKLDHRAITFQPFLLLLVMLPSFTRRAMLSLSELVSTSLPSHRCLAC